MKQNTSSSQYLYKVDQSFLISYEAIFESFISKFYTLFLIIFLILFLIFSVVLPCCQNKEQGSKKTHSNYVMERIESKSLPKLGQIKLINLTNQSNSEKSRSSLKAMGKNDGMLFYLKR